MRIADILYWQEIEIGNLVEELDAAYGRIKELEETIETVRRESSAGLWSAFTSAVSVALESREAVND